MCVITSEEEGPLKKQPADQKNGLHKTETFWDDYQSRNEASKGASWWDSPVIVAECQRRISGDATLDIYQFFQRCLQGRLLEKGISICSGSGEFERAVLDNGLCGQIDAYELSEKRVKEGKKLLKRAATPFLFIRKTSTRRFLSRVIMMSSFPGQPFTTLKTWKASFTTPATASKKAAFWWPRNMWGLTVFNGPISRL